MADRKNRTPHDIGSDEHTASVRKGYEAAQDPERQGDGDPGPDPVSEQPSRQGHDGAGSGGAAGSSAAGAAGSGPGGRDAAAEGTTDGP